MWCPETQQFQRNQLYIRLHPNAVLEVWNVEVPDQNPIHAIAIRVLSLDAPARSPISRWQLTPEIATCLPVLDPEVVADRPTIVVRQVAVTGHKEGKHSGLLPSAGRLGPVKLCLQTSR